ncbi:MAG: hypothetical protein C4583_03265 [Anaerolineaceae bacterium]|nr:MAG: hypothetical protein C4583_03265 [Anaerolineaceae bacterium]
MPTYVEILDAEIAAEQPITVSLMTRLRDNALSYLGAPSGTRMLFQQSSAPLGWTKVVAGIDDRALRVTTGNVVNGGSIAFSSVFTSRTPTGTADTNNMGSAAASVTVSRSDWGNANDPASGRLLTGNGTVIGAAGIGYAGADKNPAINLSNLAHGHNLTMNAMNFSVAYLDVIVAEKD